MNELQLRRAVRASFDVQIADRAIRGYPLYRPTYMRKQWGRDLHAMVLNFLREKPSVKLKLTV